MRTVIMAMLLCMATYAFAQAQETVTLTPEQEPAYIQAHCPNGKGKFTEINGERTLVCEQQPTANTAKPGKTIVIKKGLTPQEKQALIDSKEFSDKVLALSAGSIKIPKEVDEEEFKRLALVWLSTLKEGSPEIVELRKLLAPRDVPTGTVSEKKFNAIVYPLCVGFVLIIAGFVFYFLVSKFSAKFPRTASFLGIEPEVVTAKKQKTAPPDPKTVTAVKPASTATPDEENTETPVLELPVRTLPEDKKFQEQLEDELKKAATAFASDPNFVRVQQATNDHAVRLGQVEQSVQALTQTVDEVRAGVGEIQGFMALVAEAFTKAAAKKKPAAKAAKTGNQP